MRWSSAWIHEPSCVWISCAMLCASSHRSFFASHNACSPGESPVGGALSVAALCLSSETVIGSGCFPAFLRGGFFAPCLFGAWLRDVEQAGHGCRHRLDQTPGRTKRFANNAATGQQDTESGEKEEA